MTPMPTSFRREEEYFDYCESCGRLMMTTNYQLHLLAVCQEWHATSLDEIRNTLIASGVHYPCEVTPGYCESCSAR
jgi:hypothetical protein